MKIKLTVNDTELSETNSVIPRGSSGANTIEFMFSKAYSDLIKLVCFTSKEGQEVAAKVVGRSCEIPGELTNSKWIEMYVEGIKPGSKIKTNTIRIKTG